MSLKNTNYNIIKANDPNDGHELWSVSLSVQFMAYQLYFDKSLNYLIVNDSGTICFYDIESGRIINRITDAWNFHIDSNRKTITIVKSEKYLIEYKLLTRKELIEKAANDLKDIDLSIEDKKQFLII